MDFNKIEPLLVQRAESWKQSQLFESTINSDNTPYTIIDNIKMRAIFVRGTTVFQVNVRSGCSGGHFATLKEAYEDSMNEAKDFYKQLKEKIKNNYQ